ncbi:MAG TPA: SIMPL domain-containing protein, partial [Vicinamibacterales bacterium]|nr:SIMPL domain-containing protein [Vicinamibacterales bacterium]
MDRALVPALVLAAGIAAGGLLVGHGFARGRAAEHFVTVKGISERNVTADLAIWPLRISAANNDLGAANAQIEQSIQLVRQFLQRHKLDPAQASLQDFSVTDAATNQFG